MVTEPAEDIGKVTAIDGNRVTVEIERGGGCKSCGMKGLCGSNNTPVVLHFETDEIYQIGDRVKVSVSSGIRILSSIIIFVLPLLALFVFYLIGRRFVSELGAILIGFTGLGLSFIVIRLLDKCIGRKINFQLGGRYEDLS